MAVFVPHYKYDIVISYAHVDNEPAPGVEEGWVSTLAKGLKRYLAQKLGGRELFYLWMDYQLSPHEPLTPEIIDAVGHTALLVVILSPGYLASQWCQKERCTFLKTVREQPLPNERIFIVEREKMEESERPAELRDLLGYHFWVGGREGKPPRTLGDPTPKPDDLAYYDQLRDLSNGLAEELKRLRSLAEKPSIESAGIESSCIETSCIESGKSDERPAVFLAEVAEDLIQERDAVKRYLDQAGIRVLQPEISLYFTEPDTFQQAVDRDLMNSKIFVQLLSNLNGKMPPKWSSYIHFQYERAVKAEKLILQWRSPSLKLDTVTDEDHRKLLEGEMVAAVGLEEFKQMVAKRALIKPAASPKPMCTLVFLDVSSEDSPLADEIVRVMDKNNIGYARPLRHGTPSEIRKELQKFLLESDGIIIVYGSVTPAWARDQLLYCHKLMYKREQPLKAIAIYEGPPEEKDPLDFTLPDMQIIECRRCLIEEKLLPFFESLKAEGRA
jgi:hypothetical protein